MSRLNSLVTVLAFVATMTVTVPGMAETQAGGVAGQPVQVFGFLSGHTRLYYKNRNRYHTLAYQQGVRIFNKMDTHERATLQATIRGSERCPTLVRRGIHA